MIESRRVAPVKNEFEVEKLDLNLRQRLRQRLIIHTVMENELKSGGK